MLRVLLLNDIGESGMNFYCVAVQSQQQLYETRLKQS